MKKPIIIFIAVVLIIAAFIGGIFLLKYLSNRYFVVEDTPDYTKKTTVEEKNYQTPTDFTVTDAQGNEVSLSSLKGKSVVVNFWADWCPPCLSELPSFQKAYEEYDDVVFMMVNVDGTPDYISAFAQRQGYSFPIYYDSNHSAYLAYGLSTIPKSLFVDPDGKLVKYQIGMMDENTLYETIEQIRR